MSYPGGGNVRLPSDHVVFDRWAVPGHEFHPHGFRMDIRGRGDDSVADHSHGFIMDNWGREDDSVADHYHDDSSTPT